MTDVTAVDDLKAEANTNKFLRFAEASTYNKLLDIIKKARETPALLKSFQSGGEDVEKTNAALQTIVDTFDEKIRAETNEAVKEVLVKEKAKMEQKMKAARKVTTSFVLKFLLATNAYKEVQALSAEM